MLGGGNVHSEECFLTLEAVSLYLKPPVKQDPVSDTVHNPSSIKCSKNSQAPLVRTRWFLSSHRYVLVLPWLHADPHTNVTKEKLNPRINRQRQEAFANRGNCDYYRADFSVFAHAWMVSRLFTTSHCQHYGLGVSNWHFHDAYSRLEACGTAGLNNIQWLLNHNLAVIQ